jgi:ATP-binding cassette, subfamily A (ABC1), member 3
MLYTANTRPHLILVNNGPRGGDIDRVIDAVATPLKAAGRNVTITNDDTVLLEVCRSGLTATTPCFGAAVFYSSPREGGKWNYTLRADAALGLTTVDVRKSTNDAQLYVLPLQHAIDSAIAATNSTGTSTALPSKINEYPFTSKTEDQWKESIKQQLVKDNTNFVAVVWFLGFIGVTYHLVGLMAKERETEMSDLLESMMPNLRRWEPQLARLVSHHLAFTITYGPSWIVMGIIAKVGLFTHSSGGIIVIGFILAGLALVSLSILGASFFKKAQLSGISVVLVVIVLGIITQIETKKMSTATVVVLSALFMPMAFVNFLIGCTKWESNIVPINLVKSPPDWNHWAVSGIVFWICMILQIFWYPLLAAFVERWLYGTAAGRRGRKVKLTEDTAAAPVKLTGFTKVYSAHLFLRPFIWLFRIKPEPVIAVQDLNMSANKGEIMVLVGANGCGKSTTLNAIAGLGDITRGTIEVDGTGGIGLCPQKNVLWNALTVRQHAQVFNGLKTAPTEAAKEDIASLVATCDLKNKIDTPSRDLSGGQKRKLQLIMMLTGGSRVCCVDEVSGGLDPLSRRSKWPVFDIGRTKS